MDWRPPSKSRGGSWARHEGKREDNPTLRKLDVVKYGTVPNGLSERAYIHPILAVPDWARQILGAVGVTHRRIYERIVVNQ